MKPSPAPPFVSQLIGLVHRAEDAERFEKMASSLLTQNRKLQEEHTRLSNMLGQYIKDHGPLILDLRDGGDAPRYEIQMVPTEQLGKMRIISTPTEN